jgi:hypothetical protein
MRLSQFTLERILGKHENLIENNEFETLFRKLFREYDPGEIGGFSAFMYDAGVDYLEEMEYVPMCAFSYVRGEELPLLNIPKNITSIEDYAFFKCSIPVVSIPNTVQEIAPTAFALCNINEINYGGTKEQWYDLNVNLPREVKINFEK